MKWLAWTARVVLAGLFLYFGAGLVFGYTATPPATGLAACFRNALAVSGYIKSVGVLEVLGGGFLLCDVTVAPELLILGAIIVNIALYHIHFRVPGMQLVSLCIICEGALLVLYRNRFMCLLKRQISKHD